MLVLSRKVGESIIVDNNIQITITELRGRRVKIGIQASPEVPIQRGELTNRPGFTTQVDLVASGSSAVRCA